MDKSDSCFYRDGLAFECQRCSACCRNEPGFVFLSQEDLDTLCLATELKPEEFITLYCHWVPWPGSLEVLSLREKSNNDCIFWGKNGCEVYQYRPFQCSSYPFWSTILTDKKNWDDCGKDCPGIGKGSIIPCDTIEAYLASRQDHPYLTREIGDSGGWYAT